MSQPLRNKALVSMFRIVSSHRLLLITALVVLGVTGVVVSRSSALKAGPEQPVAQNLASGQASHSGDRLQENLLEFAGLRHRVAPLNTFSPLATSVAATKTDSLFTDVDGDLQADPGDTLKYTVNISASGGDATGVSFTDTVDPNTTFVPGSLTATPVAVDDSYSATGNVRISVPAPGVLGNDFTGVPSATITGAPTLSANNGNVALNADGSFTYNPFPGFEGTDTFTYTLTNSEGSNNATVTITVSGMIWFVNNAASCPCDGRLTNPFVALTGAGSFDAVAADDPGDNIFLYSGAYTGGLTLLNTQKLLGQGAGASLASITGLTPPTYSDPYPATGGARPTVQNAAGSVILLGAGNYLRGFDIGNSAVSGSGISGSSFGTLTVTELAISGTGRALNLNTGTLGATIDSISSSNSTTNGITLDNVGGNFAVSGATTITNATQEGLKISNVSNIGSPSLQFDGTTINSRNATGILLDNVDNSSGTMSFGATSIPNPNNAGGYGIRVQNSSAAVTFASATINNAKLVTAQNDVGPDGIPDNDGDGDAIFLTNNPGSFTLNGGTLSNCGNDCIDLRDSAALVLSGVNISNPGLGVTSATGAGFGGHGISAINLTGTSSITGGTISGWNVGNRDGLYLTNTTSTALTLTIEGTTFQNSTGNRGIGIGGRNAANMTVTVGGPTNSVATNCIFSNISGPALQSAAGATVASTATVNLTVQNSTFQNSGIDRKTNLLASVNEAGKSTVVIQDNTFSNVFVTASTAEALIGLNNSATLAGNQMGVTIQRNNINNVGSSLNTCAGGAVPCRGPATAISVLANNGANMPTTINIDDNTLTNVQQSGIFVDMANTGAVASNINTRITNNCVGKLRVAGTCTGVDAPVGSGVGIASGRGIGIERRTAGGKQANVLIDGNTVRNGVGLAGSTLNSPGVFARAQNDTVSSITLTNNNIDTNFTGGIPEVRLDTAGTATQCDDINGNIFPALALAIIDINEAAGSTHNVEQASSAAVTAANGGVTVTPDAGVAFGIVCATPPSVMFRSPSFRDYLAVRNVVKEPAVPQQKAPAKVQISREANTERSVSRSDKSVKLHHANAATQRDAKKLSKALRGINRAGALNMAALADVNLAIGTLPAGESVTITFRVTVDDPFGGAMAQVSNQGTVSGSNFADVLTDDPTVGGAADPTVTPIDLPDVTVTVSPTSVLEDGATNLVYTFTRNGSTANAMTVNFSVGGSASLAEPDYSASGAATFTATSGTVVIPGGSSTATVTIDPSSDSTVEPDETVVLTVTSGAGYDVGSPSAANGTITNDDTDVSVAVSPASVTEDGATNLVYTFTRVGLTSTSLTVNFNIDVGVNDAVFPVDYSQSGAGTYAPPVGQVTFAPGNSTATVTVDPVADAIVEPDETVTYTVTAGAGYNVGSPSAATGSITNDDAEVSVAVSPSSVSEDGATNLVYTFTRTGFTLAPVTVNFSVGGSAVFSSGDYSPTGAATYSDTSGTVVFGAGDSTATVNIDPSADTTVESDETVVLTVTAGVGYNVGSPDSATATITNDDTDVSVTVSPGSVSEDGATNLVYTFTRAGVTTNSLTVNFSVGGGAIFPADYAESGATTFTSTSGSVTFAPGNSTTTVTIDPASDTTVELDETVDITVTSGAGYNVGSPNTASGIITNDDTDVSVAVSPASVAEDGAANLVYTFSRVGVTSNSLTVNFSVSGSANFGASPNDYQVSGATSFGSTSGTVTFLAGSSTATVTVNPETDTTIEADETVMLSLTVGAGYNVSSPPSATGTITNDDADVSVAVAPASVAEDGAANLLYTFTRTGFTGGALTVNFSVGGTATFGVSPDDYTQTGATTYTTTTGSVTFAPASSTATVTVNPETDTTAEADETVVIALTAGASYNVVSPSSATGTILNDDTLVSVVVAPSSTAEGGANLVYTFTRTGPTTSTVTANFSVGGSASFPADYTQSGATTFTPPTATVTFAVGSSTNTVTVTPLTDCAVEGSETVVFTVQPGTGYGVGSPSSATGTINNTPDSSAPTITLIPNVNMTLWPPNHQYESIAVTDFVASASDNCDPSVNVNSVYILKITSDEVENGNGDGNTLNDIVIGASCKTAQLRSERDGSEDGRVYTITFKVKDSAGNFATATAQVTVRKSPNKPAVDSGTHYTVNSICP